MVLYTCARLCPLTKRNSLISIKNKGGEVGIILTTTGNEKGAATITVLRVSVMWNDGSEDPKKDCIR